MNTHDMDIVRRLRTYLADQIGQDRFDRWFAGGDALSLGDGQLVVTVANPFYLEWLRRNFRAILEQAVRDVAQGPLTVRFDVVAQSADSVDSTNSVAPTGSAGPNDTAGPAAGDSTWAQQQVAEAAGTTALGDARAAHAPAEHATPGEATAVPGGASAASAAALSQTTERGFPLVASADRAPIAEPARRDDADPSLEGGRSPEVLSLYDGQPAARRTIRHGGKGYGPSSVATQTAVAQHQPRAAGPRVRTGQPLSSTRLAQQRPSFADLATYVVGPSNRLAHCCALSVAERPGSLSPLVLTGPTGVGKTHLLQGLCGLARRYHPRLRMVCLSAEEFTSSFLEALRGSGLPSFRRKYRDVELLAVDDVQFFGGKRATLTELLYTIESLTGQGRQVVFTSDRPPGELQALGPELVARLAGGMVCQMQPPDIETRRGIVRQLAMRMKLALPDDVAELIAASFREHARQLSGALYRLLATSQAWGRPLTRELAEQALSDLIDESAPEVRLADVDRAVCQVLGLSADSLRGRSKSKDATTPRMLAMWLARKHTRAAMTEISGYFGRRSHTSVVLAQKKVHEWIESQTPLELHRRKVDLAETIRRVEQRLKAM